ncbi:MAG: MFS transporter [Bacteroidetes bacterium]|uniref:MFS transporter n=1 Tax=Phnomibacter sp. TaxID=2836217 RepID=UPI002FDCC0D2|nr:MFS transporter [Bacteroidota bacterium]
MNASLSNKQAGIFSIPVLVAALGYFVDIYDLLLFSIIRVPSLRDLGLTDELIKTDGERIISWQMAGLMIGGVLWGVLGDKKGRLSVLFGSILLYSLANIANGFATTIDQYAIIRFIAGIGLAGELGAGITLVSELTPKEKRGVATSLVAGIGLTGAVVAFIMKENFGWRTCYFIGGGLGFLLLILRISVFESGMFHEVKGMKVQRGNFFMLFSKAERLKRYILSILIGLPTWFVIGILVTFSKEFGEAFGIKEPIDSGKSIMFAYAAIAIGDILIGLISQWFKSRKKALYLFYGITIVFMILFFTSLWNGSANAMYWICAGLGFGTGFWAIFVTMGAEQFGTNIRATAATTIPNMVRGMLTIMILPMFKFFRFQTDYVTGGMITGAITMLIAIAAAIMIKETFHKDLNYVEVEEMMP